MISVQEYARRVAENAAETKRQAKEKSFDLSKYHGFDTLAGTLTRAQLSQKSFDILAATILGVLPYLRQNTGADAVELSNGYFIDIELKTSRALPDPRKLFRTERGTLYFTKDVTKWTAGWIDRNKTSTASSQFSASFDINGNRDTKNRKTYLICIDDTTDEVICIHSMEGPKVLEFLTTSQDIKLGSFMKYGTKVTSAVVEIAGWENWCNKVSQNLVTLRCSSIKAEQNRIALEATRIEKKRIKEEAKARARLIRASLKTRSQVRPKSGSTQQTPNLCSSVHELTETQHCFDTQPTSPSVISL